MGRGRGGGGGGGGEHMTFIQRLINIGINVMFPLGSALHGFIHPYHRLKTKSIFKHKATEVTQH